MIRPNQAHQILDNITDKNLKNRLSAILNNKIVMQVVCGKCKHTIADVDKDNKITPVVDTTGVMWLLAFRPRLDGEWGFQCRCGNDSRLCDAEKNIEEIEDNRLTNANTKVVLDKIHERLKTMKKVYTEVGNTKQVDNFLITKLNGL